MPVLTQTYPASASEHATAAAEYQRFHSLPLVDQQRELVASQRIAYAGYRATTREMIAARWRATRQMRAGDISVSTWAAIDSETRFHARWSKAAWQLLRKFERELAALEDLARREHAARLQEAAE